MDIRTNPAQLRVPFVLHRSRSNRRRALVLGATAAALLFTPLPLRAKPACPSVKTQRATVWLLDRAHSWFSERTGYESGFIPLLADDVVLVVEGQPILQGKASATEYYRAIDPDDRQRLSWRPTRIDASAGGSLGYSFGWTETLSDNDEVVYGENIAVWWRSENVGWRVAVYYQSTLRGPPDEDSENLALFPDESGRCPQSPSSEEALLRADTEFSARSVADGRAVAFSEYAAPEGALRRSGVLVVGPEAIAESLGNVPDGEELAWDPQLAGLAASYDIGWTVGPAIYTVPTSEGELSFPSKYLTVWQRQNDGAWRYAIDGGNARPAD
ncbi:MAG: hypothetical protein AAF219_04190 [Myxococcota bacterium]